jgi:aspartate 1-decarboxylase
MIRTLLGGKIHRVTVTGADLNYIGSITVDAALLEAANILPFERVQVVNVTNGQRLETYAIGGEPGSGTIQLNGAAAHLCAVGDIVIVMSYVQVNDPVPDDYQPRTVLVDEHNRIREIFGLGPRGGPSAHSRDWCTVPEN